MSEITKRALATSLKKLLSQKELTKISIKDITDDCGIQRQTFYYHFDNIYDLMSKAFEYELVHESHIYEEVTWEYAMSRFLQWIKDNRVIIRNILTNAELPYLKKAMYPLIARSISCGYFSKNTEAFSGKKQEEFCNDFFTLGITQYVLEWAENDFREPIEDIIAHLSWLLQKVYA